MVEDAEDPAGPAAGSVGEPVHLSGEQARQGEIVLRTPARRAIFVAGLIGVVILALIVMIVRG
jgi:hypothetical protein